MTDKKAGKKIKRRQPPATPEIDTTVKNPFNGEVLNDGDKVFIECPGATIYEPGTRTIMAGVRFRDSRDPAKGYDIINRQVFAPGHKKRRLVRRKDLASIRRCQACQDLTIRMMRREGPDFYIPNNRNPRRKFLKPIDKTW